MEAKPALCPAHRSLLPDGKQLILRSSTALSQSLPCLFLERGLYTPPPSLPLARRPPFPGSISQRIGNPFPTAWDISLSIVGADMGFCLASASSSRSVSAGSCRRGTFMAQGQRAISRKPADGGSRRCWRSVVARDVRLIRALRAKRHSSRAGKRA
jgi:hypothetical protein